MREPRAESQGLRGTYPHTPTSTPRPFHGFLIVDKPAGWTSHDVVARVRRLAGQKRVGHTGTLDPDATGVLIVCLGHATRLIEFTEGFHKVYRACLTLGVETDSQDASGAVVRRVDSSEVTLESLEAVLPRFRGNIQQVPPMVSAVHHQGERLYEIARRGETVERQPRPITVYQLRASDFTPGEAATASLVVETSGGAYIRTLCHDIGEALGVGGHMQTLRRLSVGPFSVDESETLDALATAAAGSALANKIHPMDALLPVEWPRVAGSDTTAQSILQGRSIPADEPGEWAVFQHQDRTVAVLRRDGDEWRPAKVFPE